MKTLFKKYSSTPPIAHTKLNRSRGSGLLVIVVVAAMILSMMALATARMSQAAFGSTNSSKITLQSQQYAQAEAVVLRATNYDDLEAHTRAEIQNSEGFQREVELSAETDYTDEIKQRIATIRIYNGTETLPRYTLKTVLLSVRQEASGVPIGTIIAWASTSSPDDGGVWLLCNGQSCAAYPELVNVLGKNTVPNYTDKFLQGNTTPNTTKEAGLPNIKAAFTFWDGTITPQNGAIYKNTSSMRCKYGKSGKSEHTGHIAFDASRSSSIYGASTTVQPPAVTVRFLIKAA